MNEKIKKDLEEFDKVIERIKKVLEEIEEKRNKKKE